MSNNFFEAGKTYIENEPYRAPETIAVFKVEWVGWMPEEPGRLLAFGFMTPSYPGDQWQVHLATVTQEELDKPEDDFTKIWVEAVWNTTQNDCYWRMKTPEEM